MPSDHTPSPPNTAPPHLHTHPTLEKSQLLFSVFFFFFFVLTFPSISIPLAAPHPLSFCFFFLLLNPPDVGELHLLGHPDSDTAEALAHSLKEWVAEGVHTDRVDAADAVDLNHVALDARHHSPDVQEGQNGKENTPDQRQGDADQRRQQPVAPVFGDGEGCETGFPHTVEAGGPCRFCNHIFKIHLRKIKADELEIASKHTVIPSGFIYYRSNHNTD